MEKEEKHLTATRKEKMKATPEVVTSPITSRAVMSEQTSPAAVLRTPKNDEHLSLYPCDSGLSSANLYLSSPTSSTHRHISRESADALRSPSDELALPISFETRGSTHGSGGAHSDTGASACQRRGRFLIWPASFSPESTCSTFPQRP